MTKYIECVMTVVAKYDIEDSRENYGEEESDERCLELDRGAVEDDEITVWDLDNDAKITYTWRIIDDSDA